MTTTTVTANADGTRGDWTTLADGTTNLNAGIDEGISSANDSEGIKCGTENDSSYFLLQDMPETFSLADTGLSITVRIRGRNSTSKGDAIQMGPIQLVKADESTALTNALTPAFTSSTATWTVDLTLTGDRDKASFDGARLKISSGTGTAGTVQVYTVDVDIDHSEKEASSRLILVRDETPLVWTSSGGDYALDCGSLANDAARQGAKGDLGATRARRYTVEFTVYPDEPSGYSPVELYWSGSGNSTPGEDNPGDTNGTDSAFQANIADVVDNARNLIRIGTLSLFGSEEPQTVVFGFEPPARYGMPVVVNRCGEDLHSDGTQHSVTLHPLIDEFQE